MVCGGVDQLVCLPITANIGRYDQAVDVPAENDERATEQPSVEQRQDIRVYRFYVAGEKWGAWCGQVD